MRGMVERWDEQTISGYLDFETTLTIELSGKRLGEITAVRRSDDSRATFSLDTTFFPASCLSDIRLRADDVVIAAPGSTPYVPTNVTYHSPFGGMWIDRADWQDILERKIQSSEISEDLAENIRNFVRDGFVILPKAVSSEVIDRLNADIDSIWSGEGQGLKIETYGPNGVEIVGVDPKFAEQTTKLLDTYWKLESARVATAAPAAVEFMRAVFEDRPRAFQQLHFLWGSGQPIHKDTAYVKIDGNPMSMVASWLALEDIQPGTGELEYYVGSHRAPDFIFGSFSKWMEASPAEHDMFLAALHKEAETHGYKRSSFLPKAGDVLLWHADLAHGGSTVVQAKTTRKSLVTHFTAARNKPYYARQVSFPDYEDGGVVFTSSMGAVG